MKPALIIRHPSAPPVDLPTPESIAAAFRHNCTEREKAGIDLLPMPANVKPSALYRPYMPTSEQIAMFEATDGIYALIVQHGAHTVNAWAGGWLLTPAPPAALVTIIDQYGADKVRKWVRGLAPIAGERSVYIDRPADRCLADGAPLVNSICTKCGSDNS